MRVGSVMAGILMVAAGSVCYVLLFSTAGSAGSSDGSQSRSAGASFPLESVTRAESDDIGIPVLPKTPEMHADAETTSLSAAEASTLGADGSEGRVPWTESSDAVQAVAWAEERNLQELSAQELLARLGESPPAERVDPTLRRSRSGYRPQADALNVSDSDLSGADLQGADLRFLILVGRTYAERTSPVPTCDGQT